MHGEKDLNTIFALKNCLFAAVEFTENVDPDNYSYSGYGVGFDSSSPFSILNSYGKNFIYFGVENRSSVHTEDKKKIS